jgi:hypothetical protein
MWLAAQCRRPYRQTGKGFVDPANQRASPSGLGPQSRRALVYAVLIPPQRLIYYALPHSRRDHDQRRYDTQHQDQDGVCIVVEVQVRGGPGFLRVPLRPHTCG